jgi:nucleoside-diphosphate-sugar epimerase
VATSRAFAGTRAAVTGAGGFIGGAVARRLVAEGAEVVGIDVTPGCVPALEAAAIEPRICDITDRDALSGALAGAGLVIHTAAFVHEGDEMEDFIRVNVGGTASVLDAAAAAGCERAVHVSSVVVYGYDAPGEQDERAHLRTVGIPYIDTKSASDRLARRRGAVVVRPGDVYGPGSIPWLVRPLELAGTRGLAVPGAGDGIMLPVYIDDLVAALLAAAERGEPGQAYAAWSGTPVSFHDYFSRIAEIAGGPPPRRLPRPLLELAGAALERWAKARGERPALTQRSATFVDRRGSVSIERARTELGWEPRVGLDEGLRRCAEWARERGLAPAGGGGAPVDD